VTRLLNGRLHLVIRRRSASAWVLAIEGQESLDI
jgi:hypothetical protein